MDITNLAISIAALYTTCRDGYNFFTTLRKAETESSAHLRELEIQQSILKAWGFHWQIQSQSGGEPEHSERAGQKQTRLQKYLSSNPFKAEGVLSALSALADTLSNQKRLTGRYGIQLVSVQAIQEGPELAKSAKNVKRAILNPKIKDVEPVINEFRNRLSVLNKFKWALKDKENFKKLIAELRSHSDSLYRLCPENAFESMNIYFIMECLFKEESPAGLKRISSLATEQAEVDGKSSVRQGYELLASAATLKASVNQNRNKKDVNGTTLPKIDGKQHQMWYLGKGLAIFEEQVVYVEMRDYRGPPRELTTTQKEQVKQRNQDYLKRLKAKMDTNILYSGKVSREQIDKYNSIIDSEEDDEPIEIIRPDDPELCDLIRNFFNTFHGVNMMESVYGLDIAGMIDHKDGEHKGHCSILYRLPGTIGVQSRDRPAENLKLRAPVTLQSLLGTKQKQGIRSTLGARFELARKLVRAVCLLHSSGWLHKNIRAESVIFFPDHVSTLQEDQYEVKIEIDVSKPILMGYIFSRPDDIITQINAPTVQDDIEDDTKDDIIDKIRGFLKDDIKQDIKDEIKDDIKDDIKNELRTEIEEDSEDDMRPKPPMQKKASGELVRARPMRLMHRKEIPRFGSIYGRNMLERKAVAERTNKIHISGFTLDYYQHPAKHADPQRQYRHAYDVYSLGILLLEVGLWEKLRDCEIEEEDHYERRRWICREYLDGLRWTCGDTYADAVLSCLMIESSDGEIAKASERELCARIIADLEGCQA